MAQSALRIVMLHHYGHIRDWAIETREQRRLGQQVRAVRASFASGSFPASLHMPPSLAMHWFAQSGARELLALMWACGRLATTVPSLPPCQLIMECLQPLRLPMPWAWDAFANAFATQVSDGVDPGCRVAINIIQLELNIQHRVKITLRLRLLNIYI